MAWIIVGICVAVLLLPIVWAISAYNRLVTLRNRFSNSYAQIDVQLKRRYDLIPNLVETAKAYLKHERETLEAVMLARNQAHAASQRAASNPADGGAMTALVGAEAALGGAMNRFFGLMEAYPQLNADSSLRQVSEELTSTENKIAFARQAFNDAVMVYNTQREVFPSVIIANAFGFKPAVAFEIQAPEQREAPKVSFG